MRHLRSLKILHSAIIKWAIARRWLVILGAIVVIFWIFRTVIQMPLDVFPSFAPPQVEIQNTGLLSEKATGQYQVKITADVKGEKVNGRFSFNR